MAVTENDLIVGPITPANGVSLISLDFFFEREEWLEVYKSGSETALILNTDYTVTGEGTDTGSITLTTPANGIDSYSVYLVVPLERSTDFQFNADFLSGPFNLELDRVWQAMQGIRTDADRTLSISRTSAPVAPLFTDTTAERAGRILTFTSDGAGLEVGVPQSSLPAAYTPYASRAAAQAAEVNVNVQAIAVMTPSGSVLWYERDGSGTALTTADGATWSPAGQAYPDHWAENTTPGTTDMASAISAALAFVAASAATSIKKLQLLKNSIYGIATRLTFSERYHLDLNGSTLKLLAGADRAILVNASVVTLENGRVDCSGIGSCLTATGFTTITIRNVNILDPFLRGIAFLDCSKTTIDNVRVSFSEVGKTAHTSQSSSFYACLHTATSLVAAQTDIVVRRFNVDMSNFLDTEMNALDSALIIRGEETTNVYAQGVEVSDCEFNLPEGVLGVTYGSGLTRPTGIEVRTARDVRLRNIVTIGGDLTITHARVLNMTISDCVSRNQTNYCLELAGECRDVSVVNCHFISTLSSHPVSITGCRDAKLTNVSMSGGRQTGDAVAVVQNAIGTTKATFVNCLITPLNSGVDGVKLINGGQLYADSCYFSSIFSGAAGHVHIITGTTPLVCLSHCRFEGGATRPVKVTATITKLRVNDCDGIGTPLPSDLTTGTVTASILTGNDNLTNL